MVDSVRAGKDCSLQGVTKGMWLVGFQGEPLARSMPSNGKDWKTVYEVIKSTQRPWAFEFSPPWMDLG